jgi:predicted kinase
MNIKSLKQPYVLVLIGPPLSGKDTWIRKNFTNDEIVMISRDQIVLDVYGSDNYDEAFKNVNQKEVDSELQRQLRQSAQDGKNVIINMTNMTSKRRSHNLSHFGNDYTKMAVIFPILDWSEYVLRNNKRKQEEQKFIPEQVIRNMIGSYQPIREEEGFDKVISL